MVVLGPLLVRTLPALAGPRGGANTDVHALLFVESSEPFVLFPPGRETNPARDDFETYKRTQMALIRSRLVLNAALKQQEVARLSVLAQQADPVDWLQKNLRLDFEASPELLRISMIGPTPRDAAVLVNAVARCYRDEVVDSETKRKRERYDLLQDILNRYRENLREKRKELARLSELAGTGDGGDIAGLRQVWVQQLSACKSELFQIRLEKVAAETKLGRRKAANGPGDEARKAIAELEEGLAVVRAQEDVLKEEEHRLLNEAHLQRRSAVDLSSIRQEIELAEATAGRIGAEVEALKVELQAPPRIRMLARAE
jgi:hypothetical protein